VRCPPRSSLVSTLSGSVKTLSLSFICFGPLSLSHQAEMSTTITLHWGLARFAELSFVEACLLTLPLFYRFSCFFLTSWEKGLWVNSGDSQHHLFHRLTTQLNVLLFCFSIYFPFPRFFFLFMFWWSQIDEGDPLRQFLGIRRWPSRESGEKTMVVGRTSLLLFFEPPPEIVMC